MDKAGSVVVRPHFPYTIKILIDLFRAGELPDVVGLEVEPNYGYAVRLAYLDGSSRMVFGSDLGLNPAAAREVVRDKAHTKQFLRSAGVACPAGEVFLLPWWRRRLRRMSADADAEPLGADAVAKRLRSRLGFPLYLKPVDGAQGDGVHLVHNCKELARAFSEYETARVRVALAEVPVRLPDYRLLLLDGELVGAYQRLPLAIIGDGISTIVSLLEARREELLGTARAGRLPEPGDRWLSEFLSRVGLDLSSVPATGVRVILAAVTNLSAGGEAVDITDELHPHWLELAGAVARRLGLRMVGLDLACADVTRPDSDYCVLEVNASPGLEHYASMGQQQESAVRGLIARVAGTPAGA